MKTLLILISLFVTSLVLAKNITYEVDGKKYEGYILSKNSKAPAVILMHDWDGLTDYEIKRAKMLNKLGYSVFAIDLFGKGIRPKEVKDRRQHTGELYKDRSKMRKLMNEALKTAKANGVNTNNAVAMGYCFGGAAVLEFARSGADLKGFVTFHGGLKTPEGQSYDKTKGKILILHGTADKNITMDQFATLATELETAKISNEMITYSGAPHAFTVFESKRYQKAADQKSWDRFKSYLKETTR